MLVPLTPVSALSEAEKAALKPLLQTQSVLGQINGKTVKLDELRREMRIASSTGRQTLLG